MKKTTKKKDRGYVSVFGFQEKSLNVVSVGKSIWKAQKSLGAIRWQKSEIEKIKISYFRFCEGMRGFYLIWGQNQKEKVGGGFYQILEG